MDKIAAQIAREYSETFYEDGLWQLKAADMLAPSSEPSAVTCKRIMQEEKEFVVSAQR